MPSNSVVAILKGCGETHTVPMLVEAIEITGRKALETTDETNRVQYMRGVLRRKELEKIFPERAAEERRISIVRNCWDRKGFGFPPSSKYARDWLAFIEPKDLCWLIHIAGSWTSVKYLAGSFGRECKSRK